MIKLMRSFVILLILSKCTDVFGKKPDIKPDVEELYLNEGESLKIVCTSSNPLRFIYPVDEEGLIITSSVDVKSSKSSGKFVSTLLRQETVHGDTGYYGCADNDVQVTPNVYNETDVRWIYVYVQSNVSWFVADDIDMTFYHSIIGDSLVLPCRPTSPDYKVDLLNGYNSNVELGENVLFDPRIGFTLKRLTTMDTGYYSCSIQMEDIIQELNFHLTAEIAPELYPPRISDEPLRHVTRGQTLRVNCSIDVEDVIQFKIKWTPPHQSPRVSEKAYSVNINHMNKVIINELQIKDITDEDEGEYTCTVSTFHKNQSTTKFVAIHDPNNKYIKLTPRHPDTKYFARERQDITWIVDIDAYPPPELRWFLFQNAARIVEINSSARHEIITSSVTTTLKIRNLRVSDMGTYQLQAINDDRIETLNFTLEVTSRPLVDDLILVDDDTDESYFKPNSEVEIRCRAVAYPAPNITWTYLPLYEDIEIHPKAKDHFEFTETVSIATLWTNTSGKLNCSSCNDHGCDSAVLMIFVSEVERGFGIIPPEQKKVAAGDDLVLKCAASVYNYTDEIKWLNENNSNIIPSDRVKVIESRTPFTYQSILHINPVGKSDEQTFMCSGVLQPNLTERADYTLQVHDPLPPYFLNETNLNGTENSYNAGIDTLEDITLKCYVDGMPEPVITWLKDDVPLTFTNESSMQDYTLVNEKRELHIEHLLERVSGTYTCRAENRVGKIEAFQKITIKAKEISTGLIILVVILIIIMTILVVFFTIKVHREKVLRKQLMEAGLTHFEEGALECLNPELTVDDQAELLPYDKKWEFPRERLKFGKQLGSGAFGVVMKAEAHGIVEDEEITTVAVKMVRRSTESTYIRALASELKIMVHLGKHLNVVNLLGACTKNIAKRELLVIVEYCRYGNLHNYLLRHRSEFINQIDSTTGKIDLTIGSEILKRSVSVGSNNSLSIGSGNGDSISYTHGPDSQGVTMSPDGMILSNNSVQPGWRSNYRGDYKDSNLKPICTQDLLSWAFQVARGMEYLSQRKVLHGDLAARNILLAEDNIVKICDFGLAKTMYKDDNYKKKGDAPLPIKWMAIESIRDRVFSTQSDIWSFGIVLWEFFTLAKTPYPGMEAEKQYEKLIEGYRMERPEFATQEVYDIMFQCWRAKPTLRPTFTDLVDSIGDLLDDSVKMHYVDLNTPYLDMNTMIKNDYLTMMSAPDHEALSSPTRDYVNSPCPPKSAATENSYICMSPTNCKDDSDIFSPRGNSEKGHFQFPSPQRNPINSDSDSEAVEVSPMLKNNDDDDNYLKPINVHERRAEFARQRQAMKNAAKNNLIERDSGYCNTPQNLKFHDGNDMEIHDEIDNRSDNNRFPINNDYNDEIIRTQDNYINMPRQKNDLRKDTPDSFTNPSYVLMTKELGQTEV